MSREQYQYFTTFTGKTIQLCSNCPQFKRGTGWEISQCNDCQKTNEAQTGGKEE